MAYHMGNKSFRNFLFAVIMILGIALSIIISAWSYYDDKKVIQAEFNMEVEDHYSALKRELDSDLSVLASFQALYHLSKKGVKRSEFLDITSPILKQHGGIQALAWMPRVQDSEREAYERAARREGFPDFEFTERIAQGKMKRAEKRKEYFPIYFVEPYKGNEIALGFDYASTPDRLETLEVARKTGEIRSTPRITLVQETKSQFGFIVFAPVYMKGALIDSDQTRWDNLEGFALGVFRIGDIIEKAMTYLKPAGIDFFIYDTSAPEEKRLLYTHSSRTRKTPLLDQEHPETDLINSKTFEVAGRKWMVICSATPGFITARNDWHPWGLLLAGLAVTGLVAGFLFIVSHANDIEKFAKDLSDVNAKLTHEIMERKQVETEREKLIVELQEALAKVKQLTGLLPICASCKNIRDDKGYWNQIEVYISEHSETEFSHGICPDCAKKLYGKYYDKVYGNQDNKE
ncbi:MAG: CHASE domain-containing protein [Nitrospirae bacterium]|nr:CHASE domain-containing protein [Nitrospirota bacterium]